GRKRTTTRRTRSPDRVSGRRESRPAGAEPRRRVGPVRRLPDTGITATQTAATSPERSLSTAMPSGTDPPRPPAPPAKPRGLPAPLAPGMPLTALAPMQDVTDLAFMQVIARYGPPDYFFTEFFRVHAQSRPEKHILRSLTENATGRPVFAQLIGESVPDLLRTVRELLAYPQAGIDLNLGCPAP